MNTFSIVIQCHAFDADLCFNVRAHDMDCAREHVINILHIITDAGNNEIRETMPAITDMREYVARAGNDFIFDVTITREG